MEDSGCGQLYKMNFNKAFERKDLKFSYTRNNSQEQEGRQEIREVDLAKQL